MSDSPCLRKTIIGTWALAYIGAIFMTQVLLHFVPQWTSLISTFIIYVLTSLVFGLRLLLSKDDNSKANASDDDGGQKTSRLQNGCPVDAFDIEEDGDGDDPEKNAKNALATTTSMVVTKEEDAAISKDTLTRIPHEKDQGKISHQSNLNDHVHVKMTVIKDNADICTSISSNPQTEQSSPTIPPPPPRIYFLDSVKIFLTMVVVTHNTMCAFGGCNHGNWYLVIGDYHNSFSDYCNMITTINQSYFMPLFYLISAYFTPTSYTRKGKQKFLHDKAKRLYMPAIFVSFTLSPLSTIIGQVVSNTNIMYYPTPGPAWFSFWLLIFNWMYSTVKETYSRLSPSSSSLHINNATFHEEISSSNNSDDDDIDINDIKPYPGMIKRWFYGVLICGLGMFGFCFALSGYPYFYTMPVTYGSSFINNIFFFIIGIYISKHRYLSSSISSTKLLNEEVWPLVHITAFIEAVLIIGLLTLMDGMQEDTAFLPFLIIGFFILTGLFCIDMSMVVLQFFNKYFSTRFNTIGIFLSSNAYTVYLIHPIIITSLTAIYIRVYNSMNDDLIVFDQEGSGNNNKEVYSNSVLLGSGKGSMHLFVGFSIVWISTQILCWSLAAVIRKTPRLKDIL